MLKSDASARSTLRDTSAPTSASAPSSNLTLQPQILHSPQPNPLSAPTEGAEGNNLFSGHPWNVAVLSSSPASLPRRTKWQQVLPYRFLGQEVNETSRIIASTLCLTPVKPGSLMQAHGELALLATSTVSFISQMVCSRFVSFINKVLQSRNPGTKYLECVRNS